MAIHGICKTVTAGHALAIEVEGRSWSIELWPHCIGVDAELVALGGGEITEIELRALLPGWRALKWKFEPGGGLPAQAGADDACRRVYVICRSDPHGAVKQFIEEMGQ